MSVVRAHRCFTVGILFFLCAAVCTVETLPLFYLIFISRLVLGDDSSISL